MLVLIDTTWTTEQIVLTVLLVAGAVVLARRHIPQALGGTLYFRRALVLILLLDALFIFGRGGNPVGFRPDSWSDANVIVSGRNYVRLGLAANALAPQHQVVNDSHRNDPFYVYTQYPGASNLINGLWQLAGVSSDRVFRFAPGVCSLLALLLWYGIFQRFGERPLASLAVSVMATAYVFLAYADNLHFHAYAFLTTAAAVACYLRWADGTRAASRWLALSCVCVFAGAIFTWEYHLWMLLFVGLHGLLFKPRRWRRAWLLMLAALVAASAIPFAQRRMALATAGIASIRPDDARTTFLGDIYRRTIGFDANTDASPLTSAFLEYPARVGLNFYCIYGVPLLAMFALGLALVVGEGHRLTQPSTWPPHLRFLLVLSAAGAGWWCVMFQHTAAHPHVMRLILPAYAWGLAMVCGRCVQVVQSPSAKWPRIVAVATMVALAYAQFEGTIYCLRQHFMASSFSFDARGRYDGGENEGRMLVDLKKEIPPDAVIFTNHPRLPLIRYWIDRPAYWCAASKLPPDGSPGARWALELSFNHLRELHHDHLPPLYFIYQPWLPTREELFSKDAYLRFFLLGDFEATEIGMQKAVQLVEEAKAKGKCDRSFCPIAGVSGNLLCFKIDPAVPRLHQEFAHYGFPSLTQFDRPP